MPAANYTFLGTSPGGDTLFMDIGEFATEEAALVHATSLLDQHRSSVQVEIWCAGVMIGAIPPPEPHGPADLVG